MLNAANEIAVAGFLRGDLGFLDIARIVEHALAATADRPLRCVDDVLEVDREARRSAAAEITRMKRGGVTASAPTLAPAPSRSDGEGPDAVRRRR